MSRHGAQQRQVGALAQAVHEGHLLELGKMTSVSGGEATGGYRERRDTLVRVLMSIYPAGVPVARRQRDNMSMMSCPPDHGAIRHAPDPNGLARSA